jgi:hypothetical protein
VARDQADLQAAMSQVSSILQSDAIPYRDCADARYFNEYLTSTSPPPRTSWSVTAVSSFGCGTNAGVQELTVRVTTDRRSITRAVWKSGP